MRPMPSRICSSEALLKFRRIVFRPPPFGKNEVPDFDFAKARYILSFGADFLDTWGATVQYQRQFAESHGFAADKGMAKHVYLAPRASVTGLNADEWHAIAPGSGVALKGMKGAKNGNAAAAPAPGKVADKSPAAKG